MINVEMKIYAAYGSNMNIEQMAMRCPKAKVIGTGILKDYKLTFRGLGSCGVANIEPYKGGKVPIVLWNITPLCEEALDRYEGYPSLYTKQDVVVILKDKTVVKAMAYVMTKRYESLPSEPSKRYLDTIISGYKANRIPIKPLTEAVMTTLEEVLEKENERCKGQFFE